MANYATLKSAIQEVIRQNGNNEITGALMQQSLLSMINSLGADYQFVGMATPATNPGTPDHNVAYLAGPGTYPNFNAAVIHNGYVGIFRYNGAWQIDKLELEELPLYGIEEFDTYSHNASSATVVEEGTRLSAIHYVHTGDTVMAQSSFGSGIVVQVYDSVSRALIGDSTHILQAITSGYTKYAVKGVIEQDGYLLIKWKKDDGSAITINEQQEALSGLTLEIRSGIGVEVKGLSDEFSKVQSLIGNPAYKVISFLGIENNLTGYYINKTQNRWEQASNSNSFFVPLVPGKRYLIKGFGGQAGRVAILSDNQITLNTRPSYALGYTEMVDVAIGEMYNFVAPENAHYLNVTYTLSGTKIVPSYIMEQSDAVNQAELTKIVEISPAGCQRRYVDARPDSATYGLSLVATNNDWYAGDMIFVRGYKRLRYIAVYNSTSNNYYGKAGDVFYDENFEPIASRLVKRAGNSLISWNEIEIPENAWYFRPTLTVGTITGSEKITLISEVNNGSEAFLEATAERSHPYFGQKINLNNSYDFGVYANNSLLGQSAAVYGDYLFIVANLLARAAVYNLRTRQLLYTLTTGVTSESFWHCNQSSFGIDFYADNDPFPLLYISMQNNSEGRGEVHVYRIVPTYTDGEISEFSLTRVQVVYLPVMSDENCLGNPNVTIDVQKGVMWAYCRNEREGASNYRKAHFAKFAIPDKNVSVVTLDDADILDSFSDDWSMLYAQGGFIKNGKLIIMQGMASGGFIYCRVIDLYLERKQVAMMDLLADGFTQEPEGVFTYDGKIMATCASAYIFQFNIS